MTDESSRLLALSFAVAVAALGAGLVARTLASDAVAAGASLAIGAAAGAILWRLDAIGRRSQRERALRLEAEAHDSAARERTILDTAVDSVITIDDHGVIQSANPAASTMFGYTNAELVGNNVSMLMPPPYRDQHDDYLRSYRETSRPKIIGIGREVPYLRKDGSVFEGDLAVSEARLRDRRLFTGVLRDLSERRHAESELTEARQRADAAEQLASVGTLVAGLAHEIGTPMGVIQGHAKLLERDIGGDRAQWRLQTIQEQIGRISRIIQSLLNMARPKPSERLPVDLEALVETTLSFLTEKLKRRNVRVVRDFAPISNVSGDPERLQQLLLNLFLNAIDAMQEGGGELRVGLKPDGQAGCRLTVSDTGVGIEPERLERIFDAFHTSKEAGKGNGLGLTVARRIVDDHRGRIEVQSAPAEGTTFTVHLPWRPLYPA